MGAGFGTGPSRGVESTANQTPGVGAYTPMDPTIVSARGAPISGRHPQHASAVETPGPGAYGLPPTWQNGPKVSMARKYHSEKEERGKSPGPGAYNVPETQTKSPRWGFGTSSRPSSAGPRMGSTPGPGAYQVEPGKRHLPGGKIPLSGRMETKHEGGGDLPDM